MVMVIYAMNVMVAVSKNEGNLDAINTWDNAFMTFGMFQWTIGASSDKGELAALVKKIKDVNLEKFTELFGNHGLDVTSDTNHYMIRTNHYMIGSTLGPARHGHGRMHAMLRTSGFSTC